MPDEPDRSPGGADPTPFDRLLDGLASMPPGTLDPPDTARRGAVLALITPAPEIGAWSVMYTRRQAHLSSHPGQISFPGGRVEADEGIVDAAVREAEEEVGLAPDSLEVVGRLPAFYIPPSRFWMSAVVARWDRPHPLVPEEAEVAEILDIPFSLLHDAARLRSVALSARGSSWAWELTPGDHLWGATAVVTGVLLDLMTPGWSGGLRPEDLGPEREVKPWEEVGGQGGATPAPRLRDTRTTVVSAPEGVPAGDGVSPSPAVQHVWGAGVAEAVRRLHRRGPGPVLVLVGPGLIGRVGVLAAEALAADGQEVIVLAEDMDDEALDRALAPAGVIIDAMVGRGLRGVLADPFLRIARALRRVGAPIVAVDLPSGIHAADGVIGETVSADVTVTSTALVPGHVASGALPFVADLYVVGDDGQLHRAQVERPTSWAE